MATIRNPNAMPPAGCNRASGLSKDLSDLLRALTNAFSDTYRPERHYMRGPGPKWHAKHAPAPAKRVTLRHVEV
jgi:hypothetical protein